MKCLGSWKTWATERQTEKIEFHIDIQLFAEEGGEKTEKATPKKRREARKKGQVLQSKEVNSTLVLLIVFLSIKVFGSFIYNEISSFTGLMLSNESGIEGLFNNAALTRLFLKSVLLIGKVMAPVMGIALVTGVVSSYVQVGFKATAETLMMKPERLNPINGFKRIFSMRGLVELIKALVKITITAIIAFSYLNGEAVNVIRTMDMDVATSAAYIISATINAGLWITLVLLAISLLDYFYQWWQYEKDLKMTKREIKEEHKQTEGNPETRQRIKQKQRQISMSRMLQEVQKADVVITNPTHYAIAIRYDTDKDQAPVVTAKGLDYKALS